AFCADFGMPHSYKRLKPEFVLIYGLQREFHENSDLNRLRTQFEQEDQVLMTFDRLEAVRDCAGYICAEKTGERFRAISVPPTMRLGPSNAWPLSRIVGDDRNPTWQESARAHCGPGTAPSISSLPGDPGMGRPTRSAD